jgi:tetratricopeptide (TPR) repeat protein
MSDSDSTQAPGGHPRPAQIGAFGRGQLSRAENQEVVRHLLSECETCRQATTHLLPLANGAQRGRRQPHRLAHSFDYARAFESARREFDARQVTWATEQAEAPKLLRDLESHPFDRQKILIENSGRFQSWALCELLLETSNNRVYQQVESARHLAQLGIALVDRLRTATPAYGESRLNDLEARAWSTLANSQRVQSDYAAADESFATAARLLRNGTGDPLEAARTMLLKASLCGSQHRFQEALALLDRVVAISRKGGDWDLCSKALITKGFLHGLANDPEPAIRLLTEGIKLVDANPPERPMAPKRLRDRESS